MGNVRTDQVKRTAKELVRRFPEKFSNDFENNKQQVGTLLQGVTNKIRNQIAGYIARSYAGEETESGEETQPVETETAEENQ